MSEAKNLPELGDTSNAAVKDEPAIFDRDVKITSAHGVTSRHDEAAEAARAGAGHGWIERAAVFFFKILAVACVCAALGAAFTFAILNDLLDHKSGWLKELLQFIKESSKLVLK